MKYRQRLVSSGAPASLQEWLAEELERRGIDGVYTRYILSLLLADTIDPTECAHLSPYPTANAQQQQQVCENRLADKSRHRRLKSWEHEKQEQGLLGHLQCQPPPPPLPEQPRPDNRCHCCQPYLDNEQRKKLAAVECLKSASEQKFGIEKLIDEVCAKLKNFQADIETNPDSELHARIKGSSNQSSPQGQAELYYAAFPALVGRPEPFGELYDQTQLLLQEPSWNLSSTAWGKENWKVKTLDIHKIALNDVEELGDESDNEKELIAIEDGCCCYAKGRLSTDPGFLDDAEDTILQPQFIVPKMKLPPTKVANVTMYTPFMSAVTYQNPGVSDKVAGGEEWDEGEKENRDGTLLLPAPPWEESCCEWGILSSYDQTEENELVTDLASKFNSELASIWETGGNIPEPALDTDNLGFSFRILSVQTPVPEAPCEPQPTSINFFIGSNLPSVWSTNKNDVKMLGHPETVDQLALSSSALSIPSLLHNLANHLLIDKVERIRGDSLSLPWSFEDSSDLFSDDGSSVKSFKLDLSEQGWEDMSLTCDGNFDERSALFVCPENVFLEDTERPASLHSSSEYLSPLESAAEIVTGIYSLWNSPSPKPPFPLKGDVLHLPLSAAPYNDKVVNWISHQREIRYSHWSDVPGRENCTLTYHKGESRFKEVVPLARLRLESYNQLDVECKKSCQHDDLCEETQEEPEENLLTSPKTHFQPIRRRDSSETESLSDTLEVPEAHTPVELLLSEDPSPELVVTPPVPGEEEDLGVGEGDQKLGRSVSSSLDEMLLLTGQFEPDEEGSEFDSSDALDVMQSLQKPVLPLLRDKSTSTDALYALAEKTKNELDVLGFGNFRKDQIWSTDSMDDPVAELNLPWKWSTTDDSEELWKLDDMEEEDAFEEDLFSKKTNLDCTLEAMRKELEEEEEELFRDINLLSDSEDFEAAFAEGFALFSVEEGFACRQPDAVVGVPGSPVNVVESWKQGSVLAEDAENFLDDFQGEESDELKLPSIPIDKVLYSSELENEWHKASQTFNIQVPKKGKSKNKIQGQQQQQTHHGPQLRKPCSFFLEGNCRRSDCKFSHNLGSITCRFWEEGSCFKGITCPFLHGYASNDPSLCQQGLGKKCKFALESEKDFPSLSTLSSSAESALKPFAKDIVVGRIIRPKKKKVSTVSVTGNKKSSSPPPPK